MTRGAPIALAALLLLMSGCLGQGVCDADPADSVCCADCVDDPSKSWCPATCAEPTCDCEAAPLDAGPDGGPDAGDSGARDAGPCGACPSPTPLCDEATATCVACLSEADCTTPTPMCDDTGACVVCLGDADCSDETTPICDAGACRVCTADTDCESMGSTPVCDEPSGRCVECTPDTEAAECATFSCSRLTNTCTETTRGTLGTCDACEADSECATQRRCVQHTFMGTDTGYFCFLDSAPGGCGDTDAARRPYSIRTELDSIDGVTATYCMPPSSTTCQGIRDTRSIACTMDEECGVDGLDDGFCPTSGTGAGACSYLCGGSFDCRSTLTCDDTPAHCRPS